MGRTKIFKCCMFFIILVTNVLFLNCARCEVYRVGDEELWEIGANFGAWSRKYNFSVGDNLVFKYLKGQHNVYEVTKATYRSCNVSTGVLAKYESGNDQVELTEAKKYWFFCSEPWHCLGGMRFGIDVKDANSSPNSTNTPWTEPTPLASSCANEAFERWSFCIYLVMLGILL